EAQGTTRVALASETAGSSALPADVAGACEACEPFDVSLDRRHAIGSANRCIREDRTIPALHGVSRCAVPSVPLGRSIGIARSFWPKWIGCDRPDGPSED